MALRFQQDRRSGDNFVQAIARGRPQLSGIAWRAHGAGNVRGEDGNIQEKRR
jgi:hypothetical protein